MEKLIKIIKAQSEIIKALGNVFANDINTGTDSKTHMQDLLLTLRNLEKGVIK